MQKMTYVPIMKTRKAERDAFGETSVAVRDAITPLFELHDVPYDITTIPAKSRNRKDTAWKVINQIATIAGSGYKIFIDMPYLQGDETMSDGSLAIPAIIQDARIAGATVVPVLGIDRPDAYRTAITKSIQRSSGLCLRIPLHDNGDTRALALKIDQLLADTGMTPPDIDLVLDLQAVTEDRTAHNVTLGMDSITNLHLLDQWRSVTLAGSGCPRDLSDFAANTDGTIERTEWEIWKAIHSQEHTIGRQISFGDYGIAHPIPNDAMGFMNVPVAIRYAIDNEWLIIKKRTIQQDSTDQFIDVCKDIMNDQNFSGRVHCSGDAEIYRIARRTSSSGNATTWKRIGFTHHLAYVAGQIASHCANSPQPGPVAGGS